MSNKDVITVTSPLLPDLGQFDELLKEIWGKKWITSFTGSVIGALSLVRKDVSERGIFVGGGKILKNSFLIEYCCYNDIDPCKYFSFLLGKLKTT